MPVRITFNHLLSGLALAIFAFALSAPQVGAQCNTPYFKSSTRKAVANINIGMEKIADFNGDGKPDIAGLDRTNDNFVVLLNDGAGNFSNPVPTSVGSAVIDFIVSDFNGDGKLDLLVRRDTYPITYITVTTFTGNGDGTFTLWNTTDASLFAAPFPVVVRLGADPRPQILAGRYYFSVNSNGTLTEGDSIEVPVDGGGVHPGDFNGDGKTDFVYYGVSNNVSTLILRLNQGNGTFVESSFNDNSIPIGVADLNNDGKDDIIVRSRVPADNNKLIVFLSSTSGNFTRVATNTDNGARNNNVQVGDFNGDGIKDLLTVGGDINVNDPYHYTVYFGNGSGGFTETTINRGLPQVGFYADFDGDGKTDYITTSFSYYFSTTAFIIMKNVCALPGQTGIVDFDGDGATDFALWRPSDGRWSLHPNPVTQVFWGLGSLGDVPTPGDYDGDGKTDVAVWRSTNGYWYIRRTSDSTAQYLQWGTNGDKPVQGDYDGDGVMDVAVYRPSTGNWYIRNSSNGSFRQLQFGIAEDKPVAADYDGDGKTDIAVYRPSTGVWYVLKSSTGQFYARQFGISEDKPTVGDYDGDGEADIAVFRPSTGIWYLTSSVTSGYISFQFGASTDDIPAPINLTNSTQVTFYRPSLGRWDVNTGTGGNYHFNFGGADEIPVSSLPRIE